jgi:putative thioredoxin
LAQNKPLEALHILQDFPASREFATAEALRPLALALTGQQSPPESADEFAEAAYQRSLTLIRRGNYPAALDALLDVLRRDRHYRQGTPHKIILALFELLGNESEMVHHYRRELASVLF